MEKAFFKKKNWKGRQVFSTVLEAPRPVSGKKKDSFLEIGSKFVGYSNEARNLWETQKKRAINKRPRQ